MDDQTYIMAFPDSNAEQANIKAAQFKQRRYEVHMLHTTKAIAVVAAGMAPYLVRDLSDSDWIVVIASHTNLQQV